VQGASEGSRWRPQEGDGPGPGEGQGEVYIHHDGKSGALIEVNCETDFVARNDEFRQLCKDLALHVVAANPVAVRREEVAPAVVEEQRRIFMKQAEDKPEQIRAKIAEGKLNSWFAESVLLDQAFVKDSAKSVRDVIMETNARVGENISVARFARFIVGDSAPAESEATEG
jgi:elongation factor Ts